MPQRSATYFSVRLDRQFLAALSGELKVAQRDSARKVCVKLVSLFVRISRFAVLRR